MRAVLVPCSTRNYGWIGLKPARCQESAARTGFVNPLSRRDAADGRFQANPAGGGQGAVGFVARRQRMYPYVILLASRPQPLGPPSTRNYGWNRALGMKNNVPPSGPGTKQQTNVHRFALCASEAYRTRIFRRILIYVFALMALIGTAAGSAWAAGTAPPLLIKLRTAVYAHYHLVKCQAEPSANGLKAARDAVNQADVQLAAALPQAFGMSGVRALFTVRANGPVSSRWKQIGQLLGKPGAWYLGIDAMNIGTSNRPHRLVSVVAGRMQREKIFRVRGPAGPFELEQVIIKAAVIQGFSYISYKVPNRSVLVRPRTQVIDQSAVQKARTRLVVSLTAAKKAGFPNLQHQLELLLPKSQYVKVPSGVCTGLGNLLSLQALASLNADNVTSVIKAKTWPCAALQLWRDRRLAEVFAVSNSSWRNRPLANSILASLWAAGHSRQPAVDLANLAMICGTEQLGSFKITPTAHTIASVVLLSMAHYVWENRKNYPGLSYPANFSGPKVLSILCGLWRLTPDQIRTIAKALYPIAYAETEIILLRNGINRGRKLSRQVAARIQHLAGDALKISPDSPEVELLAAELFRHTGDIQGACAVLQRVLANKNSTNWCRAEAMFVLGKIAATGDRGAPHSYVQAMVWYRKAAALGSASAMTNIGLLYARGQGVPQDYAKAIAWWRKAAAARDVAATVDIGSFYTKGKGVPQDYAQAMAWYLRAAAMGSGEAMCRIGLLYVKGHGVPQDYAKAMAWWRKAAAAGNGAAMGNIGLLYANGNGVLRIYAKALAWYLRAAAAGYAPAMNSIGVLYANGNGVPKDYATAMAWYRRAAAAGYVPAMTQIGLMYLKGQGVPKDIAKAKAWFGKAAAAGNSEAMAIIGTMYIQGIGVRQDYARALAWYRKAAAADYAPAMNNIGFLYFNGHGVPKDYAKAIEWYRKAAVAGCATAMTQIGVMYFKGQGVPKNLAKAKAWFEKAAVAGDPRGKQALEELQELVPATTRK